MKFLYITIYFVYFLLAQTVFAQDTVKPDDYNETLPYCFRFTWVGPQFDNSTPFNTTCDDYLEATNAKGVPCRPPLVYTYDGTPPDINYMWEHHRKSVICKQSRGQVCAKHSYTYNNILENVTYMCTKVKIKGGNAVTDGCYTQTVDGYENELCVCESSTGPVKPCNMAPSNIISVGLVLSITFLIYCNNYLLLKY